MTTSSLKLRFAGRSRADLRSILRYTLTHWGEAQRDSYANRLDAAMQSLTRYPELGRARDDLAVDLRALPVGEHVISYRASDHEITIIRILHGKMDVTRHLPQG